MKKQTKNTYHGHLSILELLGLLGGIPDGIDRHRGIRTFEGLPQLLAANPGDVAHVVNMVL